MTDSAGFQLAGSAPERYEEFVAPIMAPFVDALLDAVEAGAGHSVLDVACGTGFAARAAVARVGPAGRVVGVDINPGMLEIAARNSVAGLPAIDWRQAPADHLPVADAEFDGVVCQQGVQFFPDIQAAVNELARASRPGGRVAVTVWSPLERSPYMQAQFRAVEQLLGAEASRSFVDAFSCSADRVEAAFRTADLHDIAGGEIVADIRLPSIERFLAGHLSALPWGAAITQAHPDGLTRAVASMMDTLGTSTESDGSVTTNIASVLMSGVR